MTTHRCFCQVLEHRGHLINKHNKVISEMHIHQANGRAAAVHTVWRRRLPLCLCYLELQGLNKIQGLCGTGRCCSCSRKLGSIQCQAVVCFFDLLLTTATPNMCGGESAPPRLNTFPHINKLFRNAQPARSLFPSLSLSPWTFPDDKMSFGMSRSHAPIWQTLTHRAIINHRHICWPLGIQPPICHKWEADDVTQKIAQRLKAHRLIL